MNEKDYMKLALEEARLAFVQDEVPIGAVIVQNGKVLARGHNLRETTKSGIWHAETVVIDEACKKLGTWHLEDCDLYVTLEPCPMCAGACIQSRIRKVIYGARDPKGGSVITVQRMFQKKAYNHHPEAHGGVMKEECAAILKEYFKTKRKPK